MLIHLSPDIRLRLIGPMLILSSLLLFSQLSIAHHDLAHPFHDHESLCDHFFALDTKLSIPALAASFEAADGFSTVDSLYLLSLPLSTTDQSAIRGPPALSTR